MSIAKSCSPRRWRLLTSHSPGRVEVAGDLVKYNRHTREIIVTEFCSALVMKMVKRPLSLLSILVCFSGEVQEITAVLTLNCMTQVSPP